MNWKLFLFCFFFGLLLFGIGFKSFSTQKALHMKLSKQAYFISCVESFPAKECHQKANKYIKEYVK